MKTVFTTAELKILRVLVGRSDPVGIYVPELLRRLNVYVEDAENIDKVAALKKDAEVTEVTNE